jgi:hypothetical protein
MGRGAARLGRRFLDGFSLARFLYGFSLARRAGRMLIRRPSLTLAVLLLASLTWLSDMGAYETYLRRYEPEKLHQARSAPWAGVSFTELWASRYRHVPIGHMLIQPLYSYTRPLGQTTGLLSRWIAIPMVPLLGDPLAPRLQRFVSTLAGGGALAAAGVLFLVGLLGWVRDSDRRLRLAAWPSYWRTHYAPVFLVALIGAALMALQYGGPWWWRPLAGVVTLAQTAASIALMLAPFAIVAGGVGAGRGIAEGLRLLGRHWLALVVLFIVFRVPYELLSMWMTLAQLHLSEPMLISRPSASLLWMWPNYLGSALLGLWLAHAFMEIAKEPVAAANP